jgi:hypothetical protein
MNNYRWLWELKQKLRKWTTPIHFLFGFLCAALIPYYPVASIALLAGFAFDEWWDYKNADDEPDHESEKDWWEGLCAFAIGMGIVLLLTWLKVYPLH